MSERKPGTRAGISFRLTSEQRELQRLAHEFAERELRPIAAEWDEREAYPSDLLAKAAGVGLTSYAIPAAHGGGGADAVTCALIAEELSWGCAGLASTIQATMFPVRPLLRFGTDAQRARYLPLLAREEGTLAAIAFTEPHAGSDVSAMRAEARWDGDDYLLRGEKVYITNGGIADVTVAFAKLDGEITAFLIERDDPGVAATGGGGGDRRGAGGLRVRDLVRARAGGVRAADPRPPGRRLQAGGHGHAGRSRAPARLARGRRRGCRCRRRPARFLREGVRRGRGDAHHDRRRAGARRRRDHARPPRREMDARRKGVPDR